MHLVIPIKSFAHAKSRLAPLLTPAQRGQLAAAMLKDVMAEATRAAGVESITLVTSEPSLRALQTPRTRVLLQRSPGHGLNQALTDALAQLAAEGMQRAMVLHGDVPLVRAVDLNGLIARHGHAGAATDVVLVPDSRACGTNALICHLPLPFSLQFGENSLARHQQAAALAGLSCVTVPVASLALDVDDASALDAVMAVSRSGSRAAPNTCAWLARWRSGATTAAHANSLRPETSGGIEEDCSPSTGERLA